MQPFSDAAESDQTTYLHHRVVCCVGDASPHPVAMAILVRVIDEFLVPSHAGAADNVPVLLRKLRPEPVPVRPAV